MGRRLQRHGRRGARAPVPFALARAPPRTTASALAPCALTAPLPPLAPQNHWVRPAFGFDINTVVGLFDQWGWIVNVFDGVDDDK